MTQICIVPQVSGVGGMVSFRAKFTAGLQARGIETTNDSRLSTLDSILIIGGTRELWSLWQAKQRGVRIVQRRRDCPHPKSLSRTCTVQRAGKLRVPRAHVRIRPVAERAVR